jgi:hypothetical protein
VAIGEAKEKVVGIVMHPKESWECNTARATEEFEVMRASCGAMDHGKRGDFDSVTTGFSYGCGQTVRGNLYHPAQPF